MIESPFYKFLDLAKFDQTVIALEKDIKKLQQEVDELEQQKAKIAAYVEQAKQQWQSVKKDVDAKELAMRELDQADAEKKQKLENVKSHKEYGAIAVEIAEIKEQQTVVEQGLVERWSALEASKRAYEAAQKKAEQDLVAVHEAIAKKQETMAQERATLTEHREQRAVKTQGIPEDWLEKYTAMRTNVADPVVPVVDGNCSACFYKVIGQDMILLGKNKLLQCKDCYRFLYIPQAGSPESKTAHE